MNPGADLALIGAGMMLVAYVIFRAFVASSDRERIDRFPHQESGWAALAIPTSFLIGGLGGLLFLVGFLETQTS